MSTFKIDFDGDNYILLYEGTPLKTHLSAKNILHKSKEFIESILNELHMVVDLEIIDQVVQDPPQLGLYFLYGAQKGFLEADQNQTREMFEGAFCSDYTLDLLTESGGLKHGTSSEFDNLSPVKNWLINELNLSLDQPHCRVTVPESFSQMTHPEFIEAFKNPDPQGFYPNLKILNKLSQVFWKMSPEEQTITLVLHSRHEGGIAFPMLFAQGKCTAEEYARGMVWSTRLEKRIVRKVGLNETDEAHDELGETVRNQALSLAYYKKCFQEESVGFLSKLINSGESEIVEFKETLRFDLRNKKNGLQRLSRKPLF
jgi:hypothetical protein